MQYESARLQIASLAQSFDASGLCCRGNCGAKVFVESRLDFRGPLFLRAKDSKKFRVDCCFGQGRRVLPKSVCMCLLTYVRTICKIPEHDLGKCSMTIGHVSRFGDAHDNCQSAKEPDVGYPGYLTNMQAFKPLGF